jgi:Putative phage tail protein
MAQLAVAAAGAAVGSFFGAPQVGWLVGSFIGAALFAGGQQQKVEGPRLGDLQVQASTYGMGIPQVFGSMRIAGNVIWARPLIEKRSKSSAGKGGGGQTVVSYAYFATFAVAFAKGPVDAIRRVWADGKLIVDLSETSTQGKSFRYGEHIYRLHLGTETQAPDPVIEMHEGAGNVPGYRGLAYITFDELPLKDFGNRIPNITAEVIAAGSIVHPSQHVDLSSQGVDNWGKADWRLDPERPYIYNVWGGWLLKVKRVTGQVVYRVDIASKPELVAWWDEQGWQGGPDPYAYAIDSVSGDLFFALNGLSRTTFARLDADTLQLKSWYRQGLFTPSAMLVYAGRYLACKSALGGPVVIIDFENPIGGPVEIGSVSDGHQSTGFGLDPDKNRLYVISESNTGSQGWVSWFDASFEQHGPWHLVNDLGLPAGSSPSGIAYDRASGRVIVGASSGLFACDPETLEVQQSLLGSYSGGGFVDAWENQPTIDGELWLPHASTIWRIDTVTMTPVASWNVTSLFGLGLDAAVHDPLTEALWTSDGGVWKLWFDRAGHGSVTLGGIVSELCGRAGLAPTDLDVSELDQEVLGYMVPRPVAVREALEKLQQAYLFDVVESDWTLAFRKRERDPVLTIGDESLAAHEPGNQRPPKLLETRTQEAELPRRVTVRYLAYQNDYQAAAQQAQLIQDLYETKNELVLELPVVMTDDEAKRAAWAILASAWVERDGFELYLPPSFLTLDPGDVVDAIKITEALTATIRLRLTEVELSGGWLLKLRGVTDDPVVWQTNHLAGAPTPVSEQTGIPFEVPSVGFFLNLPALSTEDGQTGGFWLGAAPAWSLDNTKWRGAVIYRSSDGVGFTDYAAITTAVAWAKATTVLPVFDRWGVWDTENVLEVLVQSAGLEFESRTELEVLDGPNLLLVGQEIIQFADAEQLGSSKWRLSKLLRGRRGTEWAMSTHQVGEAVLVLDPVALSRTSSLDEVGLARFYRAVSIGSDPSLPAAVAFTNTAASLKPYAPVHVQGSRNGGGDLTITWVRRTHYSGDWRDLVDVPLNEASEAYEVDVLDGTGQVLRVLSSATPSVVYAAADQTADFGAPQAAVDVSVYQISAAVGRASPGGRRCECHPEPRHRAHPAEPGAEGGHRQRGLRRPRPGDRRAARARYLGRRHDHGRSRDRAPVQDAAPHRHARRRCRGNRSRQPQALLRPQCHRRRLRGHGPDGRRRRCGRRGQPRQHRGRLLR